MSAVGPAGDAAARVAQVVVEVEPAHLDRPFDYLVPDDLADAVHVGSRVEVTFAGRRRRGLVVAVVATSEVAGDRLRPLRRVLGPHAWMTQEELAVARWAADRYAAPLGDVLRHALPARVVDVERRAQRAGWFPRGDTVADPRGESARRSSAAPGSPAGSTSDDAWEPYAGGGRRLINAAAAGGGAFYWRPLPDEDVGARLADLVARTLAGGRDALVVVPDPASPTADGVVAAVGDLGVDVRAAPSPRRAYRAWLAARCGRARVVVGERGVAFWPLDRLGLAVVVDEANPALKERRSPRHHAREVALERARRVHACALLVGFVPSAAAWRLLADRRVEPVVPRRDRERAAAPRVVVDHQQGRVRTRIGARGIGALRDAVATGAYAVVLAARRGEGTALACSACGERQRCPNCGASLQRGAPSGLRCGVCAWSRGASAACQACGGSVLAPLAAGAERLAAELRRTVTTPVAVLEGYAATPPPHPAVLVTTRGSVLDVPPGPVAAVVLVDLDRQMRQPRIDAAEDTLRLSMQAARWTVAAGAAAEDRRGATATGHAPGGTPARARSGVVVAQTRSPDHPVVQALVRWDPGGFWRAEVAARAPLRFPPVATAVHLDVPWADQTLGADLTGVLPPGDEVLGPLPRDDRAVYLVKSADRVATVAALDGPRRQWSRDRRDVRIDVEPVGVV